MHTQEFIIVWRIAAPNTMAVVASGAVPDRVAVHMGCDATVSAQCSGIDRTDRRAAVRERDPLPLAPVACTRWLPGPPALSLAGHLPVCRRRRVPHLAGPYGASSYATGDV
ncbi:hypothetical protein GCM10010428_45900 [Actinosynnema pretiosum subsp. pretiosum]